MEYLNTFCNKLTVTTVTFCEILIFNTICKHCITTAYPNVRDILTISFLDI